MKMNVEEMNQRTKPYGNHKVYKEEYAEPFGEKNFVESLEEVASENATGCFRREKAKYKRKQLEAGSVKKERMVTKFLNENFSEKRPD